MKPVEDELINHIKESLSLHEEAYVSGAWESFNKKKKRKGGLIWLVRLSSAAVLLLVGFAIFYMNRGREIKQVPGTARINVDTLKTIVPNLTLDVKANGLTEAVVSTNKNSRSNFKLDSHKVTPIPSALHPEASNPITVFVQPVNESKQQEKKEEEGIVVVPKQSVIAKASIIPVQKQSFEDFLNTETEKNKTLTAKNNIGSKTENKWDLGLMVAPSIGNDKKINMGYGVSMEYAVSKKISISSGISYNQMGASKDIIPASNGMNSPSGAAALVQETKRLKSVDANLIGLDIPLELKYHFNDRFYTNVGISAFAVLNQKQNNNYIEGRLENGPISQAGAEAFKTFFKESPVSEPVSSEEARNDKYLGFYNLSIGYKQKISGKNSLSIEPFMKLPVKEYSKENLHLIGTGVRLKFDF